MTELNRTIGPVQLMLYGVGSMLGAGISIASRYPRAAGAAYAAQRAYRWPWLSHMVGIMVGFSGVASIASQS